MDVEVVYKPSAFKHGFTRADILWALKTARYDELMEGMEYKHLSLGFDTRGNLLEVMYTDLGDSRISVFHASDLWSATCRAMFIPLMNP